MSSCSHGDDDDDSEDISNLDTGVTLDYGDLFLSFPTDSFIAYSLDTTYALHTYEYRDLLLSTDRAVAICLYKTIGQVESSDYDDFIGDEKDAMDYNYTNAVYQSVSEVQIDSVGEVFGKIPAQELIYTYYANIYGENFRTEYHYLYNSTSKTVYKIVMQAPAESDKWDILNGVKKSAHWVN